jgi:DNA polymerase III alpha subunit/nucleotidyltransferase/DNA polymerase involved in DNA repair
MRVIVHLDADAFFASVEQAADSRLRGKPVAVGGEKRGIIASASYEARKFGVFTPMPTVRARKLCPKLIVLPGDFDKYEHFSRWMFSYAQDFTPDVEIASIDEGYFDLSGVRRPALDVAETIRTAIQQSLKISVSEGIASNKLVSQIASKLHKPHAFQTVPGGGEITFLHPLPNRWLPGVGPQTAQRLDAAGLARIRHIAATSTDLLHLLVGRLAPALKEYADGIDDRPVVPMSAPAKSYSQQQTFAADVTDEDYAEAILRRMADELMAKVRADRKSIRTLTVKVRYNDMAEDQCGESLPEPTDLEADLYGRIHGLFRQAWKRRVSLRLVSLKLSNVYDGLGRTELELEARGQLHEAQRRLATAVDELRRAHGSKVILRGHDFRLREPAQDTAASLAVGRSVPAAAGTSRPGGTLGGTPKKAAGTGCPTTQRQARRNYVPLNVHSHFSFLDSTLSIPAIIALAQKHGLPAVALTDTGNLHGAVEFCLAAKQAGIKPIVGAEVRVEGQPVWLYVENATGYANLCRLLSRAAAPAAVVSAGAPPAGSNGGRGARLTIAGGAPAPLLPPLPTRASLRAAQLAGFTDGLLVVSQHTALKDLFGDRFYRAVASVEEAERGAGSSRSALVPAIHCATPADRQKFDIVQSIRTRTLLRQTHPEKRLTGDFHFRSPSEVLVAFRGHPDLLDHTQEIADRCAFALSAAPPQFPAFLPPDGSAPHAFLRKLVLDGLRWRYRESAGKHRHQVEEELAIIAEVGYEEYFLVVWDLLQDCRRRGIEWITRGSAADSLVCYCLGISDVCPIRFELYFRRFLNKERMAMHKLPDIDVDFPHDRKDDVVDLIFAKYGPAQTAVVGGFSTFQARSAFAEVAKVLGVAEREVRKFTDHFPWSFGGGWVPDEPTPSGGAGLLAMLQASPENRDLPLEQEPYRTALLMAEFLNGVPRYAKMHPCGVVLSRQPMHELTPTFLSGKGYPTTHFDMDAVEAIGLVKMDILAQGGLAAMRDTRHWLRWRGIEVDLARFTASAEGSNSEVRGLTKGAETECKTPIAREAECAFSLTPALSPGERENPPPPLGASRGVGLQDALNPILPLPAGEGRGEGERSANQPFGFALHDADLPQTSNLGLQTPPLPLGASNAAFDDPAVWEMIAGGGSRAVHHIESPAMIGLCRQCNVHDIDGLIAIVSVIRPGAANEGKKQSFARRYQGLEPITYPHPSLAACLRSTFGLVVYEEHILQICEAFAGLPPGRADVLRRALNKQKRAVIEEIRGEFFAAALARGHTLENTTEVWSLAAGFAGYAFCKAHSTAYGVEAYQAAWLKRYYPVEFMAAVLSNGKGFYHPLVYVLEALRLGIRLLPPTANHPGPQFGVEGQSIRVPLTRVKGLSQRTQERMTGERQRGEFRSLADFFRRVAPGREEMEALLRVGAFDEFGRSRTAQFWEVQQLCHAFSSTAGPGQGWLLPAPALDRLPDVPLEEPTWRQRLQWETELLDFAASGHPLELFADVAWDTYCPVSRLGELVGQQVTTCGLIIEQRIHHQITGEAMKFLTLADWTGIVETELFAPTYRSYGLATVRYPVLEITATVEPYENDRGFSLRVLRAGKPRLRPR